MTNKEFASEVNTLLQSAKYTHITIREIVIMHYKGIKAEIEDLDTGLPFIFTFGYCHYFKGRVDIWANANLVLEYTEGFRKLGKRNLPENLFVLKDLASGSFVKAQHLNLKKIKNKNERGLKNEKIKKSGGGINIDLIRSALQKRTTSRVMIWNSKAPALTD